MHNRKPSLNIVSVRLRDMAFKQDVSVSEISRKTGISRTTLASLYKNTSKGITFDVLEKLCAFFNCEAGDMIAFHNK